MNKKCLIVSLKFHAGHWSHIMATNSILKELGYDCDLYVNKEFSRQRDAIDLNFCDDLSIFKYKSYDNVIVLFPNIKNLWVLCKFKFFGNVRVLYMFHEPIDNYFSFYRSGFNLIQIIKLFFVNQINKFTVYISTHILLPSKTSFAIYSRDYSYLNQNFVLIPLFFEDEFNSSEIKSTEKIFISYIGSIASDHAFRKYCDYIIYAIKNNLFQDKIFLIATSNKIEYNLKNKLLDLGYNVNLKIIEGSWLTNEQINFYYKNSAVIWNAYDRSTQSGVLPKAFMFATPVLGSLSIQNEYILDNYNGIYLKNNSDFNEITHAIIEINNNIDFYILNSRETFIKCFHYKNYINNFKNIL